MLPPKEFSGRVVLTESSNEIPLLYVGYMAALVRAQDDM